MTKLQYVQERQKNKQKNENKITKYVTYTKNERK